MKGGDRSGKSRRTGIYPLFKVGDLGTQGTNGDKVTDQETDKDVQTREPTGSRRYGGTLRYVNTFVITVVGN